MLLKRKFIATFILIILIIIVCIVISFMSSNSKQTSIFEQAPTVSKSEGTLFLTDKPLVLNQPLYFVSGHLFLPMTEFICASGGTVTLADGDYQIQFNGINQEIKSEDDERLVHQIHTENDQAYISLYDITQLFNFAAVFKSSKNEVYLYKKSSLTVQQGSQSNQSQKAYIRLEDVTFDGGVTGIFTNEKLEKLRVISDYFYKKNQYFYIAWIPLYTNPPMGIENDLTKNFNFYNADFLYTLDYMTHHNGHIVLHGLTHQEKDTVSTIGTEFGKDTPFSKEEIAERMIRAKEIADSLGFENNIFEFPHYAVTEQQLKIAEKYFDVIYQQGLHARTYGNIVELKRWGHDVLYIPTPLGFMHSAAELPDMLSKIYNQPQGQLTSLFVHPYLDYEKINCATSPEGIRIFDYDESGIIPQLIKKVTEKNMAFSVIDAK